MIRKKKDSDNKIRSISFPDGNHAEGLLHQTSDTLSALITAAPLAIIALDRSANVLIWNPAAERLFGWSEQEVIGHPYPLVPESELADFKALIEQEFRGIRHSAVELKRLHKNGSLIDVNIWTAPLHDADGKMYGVLGMLADNRERKKTEQQMHLQSAALNASANAIMITDTKGKVQWINQAFTNLTGYNLDEVIGKNPRQLVKSGKHDQAFYKNLWDTILAGNVWRGETINRRKDGSIYTEDQTISPVLNEQGDITHFIAIKQDITERKETEEALRLFRALMDQTQDAIEIIDPETGRFLDVNDRGCKDLGYSREEFLTLSVFDIDPMLDQSVYKINVEKLRQSIFLNWQGIHRRKDGSTFPVEVNLKDVSLDRDYIVAVVRDITERKRAEETQRETLRRVQVQFQAVGQVADTDALLSGDVEQVAREITELTTKVTGAERASVWLFNDDETELCCIDLYEATPAIHSSGMLLKEHEYQNEFKAFKESRYVDANDPLTDPRTAGYVETYIKPLRITSMLDIVIHASGKNFGLLCIEHVDKPHHWEQDEIIFAGQLADKIAFTIVNKQRYQVEGVLRESEIKFRSLVEQSLAGVYVIQDGKFVYSNPRFEEIFGYSHDELRLLSSILELVYKDDQAIVTEKIRQRISGEIKSAHYSFRGQRKGGEIINVDVHGAGTEWEGKPAVLGTLLNISERKIQEEKIKRLNRVYKVLSGINTLIVRVHDRRELFEEACRIAVQAGQFRMAWIGSYSHEQGTLIPQAWEGHEDGFLQYIQESMLHNEPDKASPSIQAIRFKRPVVINKISDIGKAVWKKEALARGYQAVTSLPLLVSGEVVGVMALYAAEPDFFDAEEIKLLTELAGDISFALHNIAQRENLEYLASYDPLTGLPNRTLFHEHLTYLLDRAKQTGSRVAVLVGDLKLFRHINNVLGRQAGDAVLHDIGERLQKLSHDPANVGRITGDYFAMILPEAGDATGVARMLEKSLIPAMSKPLIINGNEIQVNFVSGISVFPNDGEDAETLYRNAEAALKKAKASNVQYLFYESEMTARVAERILLENKLRHALDEDRFILHYQPKVASDDHKITGLEALIRWNDPESGLVPPGIFVPLLEETGMILNVGKWAIGKALADAHLWRSKGIITPRVAVNVSSIQLQQENFVDDFTRILQQYGNEACLLDLEVTESLLMQDIDVNIGKLTAIKELGVNISIDDFGTGYSSLSYLAKLPINALKIDRSFIITMDKLPESMTIVSSIITLAHALNLKVIAEGVETEEQAKFLRLLKCDEMQGYLFSKPLPPDDIVKILRQNRKL